MDAEAKSGQLILRALFQIFAGEGADGPVEVVDVAGGVFERGIEAVVEGEFGVAFDEEKDHAAKHAQVRAGMTSRVQVTNKRSNRLQERPPQGCTFSLPCSRSRTPTP